MKKTLLTIFLSSFVGVVSAQNISAFDYTEKTTDFPALKNVVYRDIKGAPAMSQPVWLQGGVEEIRTDKHGLAYPNLYDWDRDGRLDLIVGEFESGKTASYLKVYLNSGTNKEPKYIDKSFFATDVNGDYISAHFW